MLIPLALTIPSWVHPCVTLRSRSVSDSGIEGSQYTTGAPCPYHSCAAAATVALFAANACTTVFDVTCRGYTYEAIWYNCEKHDMLKYQYLQKIHPTTVERAALRRRSRVFSHMSIIRHTMGQYFSIGFPSLSFLCPWLAPPGVRGGCMLTFSIGGQDEFLEGDGDGLSPVTVTTPGELT